VKRVRGKVAVGSVVGVGLVLSSAALAHADGGGRKVVAAAPDWTATAPKTGVPAATDRLHLSMVLNLRDPAGAEAQAAAASDPGSVQYGAFLNSAQWRARFAPTDAQAAAVSSWLSSSGFTVTGTPANHRLVTFDGTAEQVNAVFGAQLAQFSKGGAQVVAPSAPATVPDAVAPLIAGLAGLDSSLRATPHHVGGPDPDTAQAQAQTRAQVQPQRQAAPNGVPTGTLPPPGPVFRNAPPCSSYYGEKPAPAYSPKVVPNPLTYVVCGYKPEQLRGAYGIDQALAQGYDGRGATVAVVDAYASPTIAKDAATYATRNDPRHPLRSYQFSQSLPASYNSVTECGAPGWYGEETLDVEAVHAMAPAANILYAGASSCQDIDLVAAVNSVLDNDLAQVITNSYGSTGEPGSVAEVQAAHQSALQAAAQGVSLLFSSGDNGDEIVNTGTRQVDYEASDPMVTAVGGTSLNVTKTNGYGWEQGWGTGRSILQPNNTWSPVPPAYLYGGGGGTSRLFRQPSYQKGVVPDDIANYFGQGPHRAVPDVAMDGDPNTGFLVGQTQTFPNGSLQYSEYRIGGTSLSSPLFAGVVAVANQVKGGNLGFLNPRMYKLAGTNAFHDVFHQGVTDAVVRVDYINGFDASAGLRTSLRTLNQTGTIYTRKGYDDVTGVGSPNGAAFLNAMAGGRTQNGPGGGGQQDNPGTQTHGPTPGQ